MFRKLIKRIFPCIEAAQHEIWDCPTCNVRCFSWSDQPQRLNFQEHEMRCLTGDDMIMMLLEVE